jgi:glutathione synthase/RimK-type ligase-like ATP-grasp enzyme
MTKTGPVTVASVSSCRPSAPQDLTLLPEPKLDSVSGRRLAIVARNASSTNRGLLEAAATLGLDALVLPPEQAARRLRTGDVALGRLDVLPTLDGPEPGLATLRSLEEKGVLVLNRAGALLAAHDKLMTALRLAARGLPHPRTAHVGAAADLSLEFPVVVKPRFGSWGRDVSVCRSRSALERCLRDLGRKAWFRRQGRSCRSSSSRRATTCASWWRQARLSAR